MMGCLIGRSGRGWRGWTARSGGRGGRGIASGRPARRRAPGWSGTGPICDDASGGSCATSSGPSWTCASGCRRRVGVAGLSGPGGRVWGGVAAAGRGGGHSASGYWKTASIGTPKTPAMRKAISSEGE